MTSLALSHVIPLLLKNSVSTNTKGIEALEKLLDEKLEKLESIFCPNLEEGSEDSPKNVRIDIKNAVKGTKRDLPCRDGYIQCGTSAVAACLDDNTWKISDTSRSNCVEKTQNFTNPVKRPGKTTIHCEMVPGTTISFTGTPTKNTNFFMYLIGDNGDVLLSNGYRFERDQDIRKIVFNTRLGGRWGTELRSSTFPFQVGEEFTIDIKRTSSGYQGFAYGKTLYTFEERSSSNPIKFEWGNDAKMKSLTVKYP